MKNPTTNATKVDAAGTMEMDLMGKKYQLRLTFSACRMVERALDLSFQKLSYRMRDADFRFEDMATVFNAAIVGGGCPARETPSVDDIGAELMTHPISTFLIEYCNLIAGVVTAGKAQVLTKKEIIAAGEAPAQAATSGEASGPAPSVTSESSPTQLGT